MSYLSPYNIDISRKLGTNILRATFGVAPAAAAIFAVATEQVASDADEDERRQIASHLIKTAMRICPSIFDTRH